MKRFDGMSVLITGAAGGFGRSLAELLANEGARLTLTDFNADRLQGVAKAHGAPFLAGSVADEDHCREAVELAVAKHGRLDVAINNAGVAHDVGRLADIDSAQARHCVDVDLMGVFYGMKHQLRAMVRQFEDTGPDGGHGGSILNVASLAGIGGAPLSAVYSAAKHGVVGLTKTAALEYARRGIRVNAICPSFARTAMVEEGLLEGADDKLAAETHLVRGIPMRRMAEVEEVTRVMVSILDPGNTFMTGQAIAVDGGTSAM